MAVRTLWAGAALPVVVTLVCQAADPPKPPLGLIPVIWPQDNPVHAGESGIGPVPLLRQAALGRRRRFPAPPVTIPAAASPTARPVSTGIKGQRGNRSAPTVINRAYSLAQFWDGRAATLEEQVKGPIANPIEMGNSHDAMVISLRKISGYGPLFQKAFGTERDHRRPRGAGDRHLRAHHPFRQFALRSLQGAATRRRMSAAQVRGMRVFFDKAKCDSCHEGVNFTLNAYANLGVGADKPDPDVGRFAVTKDPADWGAFKTPTLRDVARTGSLYARRQPAEPSSGGEFL